MNFIKISLDLKHEKILGIFEIELISELHCNIKVFDQDKGAFALFNEDKKFRLLASFKRKNINSNEWVSTEIDSYNVGDSLELTQKQLALIGSVVEKALNGELERIENKKKVLAQGINRTQYYIERKQEEIKQAEQVLLQLTKENTIQLFEKSQLEQALQKLKE